MRARTHSHAGRLAAPQIEEATQRERDRGTAGRRMLSRDQVRRKYRGHYRASVRRMVHGSGRPRAPDASTRARIPAMLKRGRSTPNAVKLAKKLGVSRQTVRRAAREANLVFKRPRPLTAAQRAERHAFFELWPRTPAYYPTLAAIPSVSTNKSHITKVRGRGARPSDARASALTSP